MISESELLTLSMNAKSVLLDFLNQEALKQSLDKEFITPVMNYGKGERCAPGCPICCTKFSKRWSQVEDDFKIVINDLLDKGLSSKLSGISDDKRDLQKVAFYAFKRLVIDENPYVGHHDSNEIVITRPWFSLCPMYYGKCVIHDYESRPLLCKEFNCKKKPYLSLEQRELIYDFFTSKVLPIITPLVDNLSARTEAINFLPEIYRNAICCKGDELKNYLDNTFRE